MSKISLVSATITLSLLAATVALGQGPVQTTTQPTPNEVRLSEQVSRLARQVRASQDVATKQAAVAQRALVAVDQQTVIANQNAQAFKEAKQVVNAQTAVMGNQAESLQITRMGLYVASGVFVVVAILVVVLALGFSKTLKQFFGSSVRQPSGKLHVMPQPEEQLEETPQIVVNPKKGYINALFAKYSTLNTIPFVLNLNQERVSFECEAVRQGEGMDPLVRFLNDPNPQNRQRGVAWDKQFTHAAAMIAPQRQGVA